MEKRVVVIGAGIVGVCSALELARRGAKVTLVDRQEPGMACSWGNAGALASWYCVPMAMPGLHKKVPRMLLDPEGPLSLRLGALPRTLPWLWRFHRQAREETARQVSEPLFALYHSSVELHEGLAREAGAQALIRSTRYLYLYRKPEDYNPNALEWQLRRQYGAEIEVHDGVEAIRELEPSLAPVYRRAVTVGPLARTLEPYRLTVAYADLLRRMGGTVLQAEVTRLESSPAGVSVVTRGQRLAADLAVVAAGAWSADLIRSLGVRLPLIAERGYHMTFADPGVELTHCVHPTDRSLLITSQLGGLRLAGTDELAGPDDAPRWRRAEIMRKIAAELFPSANLGKGTRWMGPRPGFPDTLPAIGPLPGHPNVLMACGHGHVGLTGAPMTGRMIAALAAGESLNIDVTPYSPGRFSARRA
ncbi:MAG: NAD(P)/FAD-dependent oxidoreductase [Hyphomicrobiaceae bacterium]